jgi:hypothetical protein
MLSSAALFEICVGILLVFQLADSLDGRLLEGGFHLIVKEVHRVQGIL